MQYLACPLLFVSYKQVHFFTIWAWLSLICLPTSIQQLDFRLLEKWLTLTLARLVNTVSQTTDIYIWLIDKCCIFIRCYKLPHSVALNVYVARLLVPLDILLTYFRNLSCLTSRERCMNTELASIAW